MLGLTTSLGEDEGWEAVPYEPDIQHRGIQLRRWFVHHHRDELESWIDQSGVRALHSEERAGNRRWLQVLAVRRA